MKIGTERVVLEESRLDADLVGKPFLVSGQGQVDKQKRGFFLAEYFKYIEIFPPGLVGKVFISCRAKFHCDAVVFPASYILFHQLNAFFGYVRCSKKSNF